MMEFMKSWITNITVVIIFTMLLDMLIPNDDMKKFTKVIMGLLIVLVIAKPFLMIRDFGYQFQSTMTQAAAYLEDETEDSSGEMEVFQNDAALNIYKQKLEDKIGDIIKSRKELQDRNVRVAVDIENDLNKENFGSIKSIEVLVDKGSEHAVQAASIKPVKINSETVINKKQDEYKWNNSKLSQDLSADIHEELGLVDTEIFIQIQE